MVEDLEKVVVDKAGAGVVAATNGAKKTEML